MTNKGCMELVKWAQLNYPLTIPAKADPDYLLRTAENYAENFRDYSDEEVMGAYHALLRTSSRYPFFSEVYAQIQAMRVAKLREKTPDDEYIEFWEFDAETGYECSRMVPAEVYVSLTGGMSRVDWNRLQQEKIDRYFGRSRDE